MKQKLLRIVVAPALVLYATLLVGCGTADPYVQEARVGGAIVGAGLGGIIAHNSRGLSTGEGIVLGTVVGGILGDTVGKANSAYRRSNYRDPRYYRYYRY